MLLGDSDLRVPPGPNGLAWTQMVKRKGQAQVQLHVYPGEGHRFVKPDTVAHCQQSVVKWLKARLKK